MKRLIPALIIVAPTAGPLAPDEARVLLRRQHCEAVCEHPRGRFSVGAWNRYSARALRDAIEAVDHGMMVIGIEDPR